MKTQKELMAAYMDIVKKEVWPNEEKMQAYEKKSCGYLVELSNGDLVALEKPSIQKNFCFAYGFCGVSTIEEEKAASAMADKVSKDVQYFINENMKNINDAISGLNECLTGSMECYSYIKYFGQPDDSKLKGINITRLCNNPTYEPGYWSNCKSLKKLDNDDIMALLAGYEELKKAFAKRLQTYLKKYGLSKLNIWTFLSD